MANCKWYATSSGHNDKGYSRFSSKNTISTFGGNPVRRLNATLDIIERDDLNKLN